MPSAGANSPVTTSGYAPEMIGSSIADTEERRPDRVFRSESLCSEGAVSRLNSSSVNGYHTGCSANSLSGKDSWATRSELESVNAFFKFSSVASLLSRSSSKLRKRVPPAIRTL